MNADSLGHGHSLLDGGRAAGVQGF
jgi:hypothetical protein